MPRVSGGDPRSAGAPAIRQPAHEGGLARVLEVVVDHADQADAERDGRVQRSSTIRSRSAGVEPAEVGHGRVVHRVVVAEEQVPGGNLTAATSSEPWP